MRKRIIAAALVAVVLLMSPLCAIAVEKPDEIASPAQLEETNEEGTVKIKESHSHLETKYEYGKRDTMSTTLYWLRIRTPITPLILYL